MELFLKIWQNLTPETFFFMGCTVAAAFFCYKKNELQKAPAILTTIAILGTFFGIAVGLLDFDANNVQKSIPSLIDGIKTAFWASIWGIFLAICFKIYPMLITHKETETPKESVTAQDLHSVLIQIKKSLSDDTDSSLITQFKLLRSDFSDFLRNASENNSKALIDALKDVMRDFNTKINEQFGDNFKQLNQAVEKILVWQEQYRKQVTEMIEQNNQSAKNLWQASQDFALISQNIKSFTQSAENCRLLIESLDAHNKSIEQSMEKLASYIEVAKNGLPDIQNNLTKTMEQMQNISVETSNAVKDKFVSLMQENDSFLKNQFNAVQDLQSQFSKSVAENNVMIQNNLQESHENQNILQKELREVLLKSLQSSNSEINEQIKELVSQTKQQVTTLDNALSEELTKSLESFAKQMASLSSRFTNDYSPLTDKLRDIVQIANKVHR